MKKMNITYTASYHERRRKQRPPQNPAQDIVIQEIDSSNTIKEVKCISENEILAVLNTKFLAVLNDGKLQKSPIEIGIDNNAKNYVKFTLNEKNEVSKIKLRGEIFKYHADLFTEVLMDLSFYHKASGKYLIIFPIRFKETYP